METQRLISRKIVTENRSALIDQVVGVLEVQAAKLDVIIVDLSKPHVDDRARARKLLSTAKKLRKRLEIQV